MALAVHGVCAELLTACRYVRAGHRIRVDFWRDKQLSWVEAIVSGRSAPSDILLRQIGAARTNSCIEASCPNSQTVGILRVAAHNCQALAPENRHHRATVARSLPEVSSPFSVLCLPDRLNSHSSFERPAGPFASALSPFTAPALHFVKRAPHQSQS